MNNIDELLQIKDINNNNIFNSLDNDQKRAVLTEENSVITAGAGSGKTHTLSIRFAYLLLKEPKPGEEHIKVNEILTLTFTKKAAGEMYSRIYQTLKKIKNSNINDNDKKLVEDALKDFDKVSIQTLDSYYLEIVQQCASRYGINPNIRTATVNNIKNKALKFVLDNKNRPGINKVAELGKLQDFAYNEVARIVLAHTNITTPKDFFKNKALKQIDYLLTLVNKKTKLPYTKEEVSIVEDLASLLDEFTEQLNEEKRNSGNLTFDDISQLAIKIIVENPDILEQENHKFKKIMIDEFQDNNSLNRDFLYLLSLDDSVFSPSSSFKLDYNEPITPQIVDSEKGINYLKEGKLFFVGDEKQSIYKFRGADISSFNKLKENHKTISMSYNYRSKPALIHAFNKIFGDSLLGILADQKKKNDYEAYFTDNAKVPSFKKDKDNEIRIHIKRYGDKEKIPENDTDKTENTPDSTDDIEDLPIESIAYEIAKTIRNRYNELKKNNNLEEPVSYSDFAILSVSRTDYPYITKYLDLLEIPYEIDGYRSIFEDAIVNDFTNFLKLCVYPFDQTSYLSYLVSPLAGMSHISAEKVMAYLSLSDDGYLLPNMDCLYKNYNIEEIKTLIPTEWEKFNNALSFLNTYRENVLSQPITTTLSKLWNDKGYKYETLLNKNLNLKSELFDMFFELARQNDEAGKSILYFVNNLEILRNSNPDKTSNSDIDLKDISYPIEKNEAVHIMTIHKSKGLEFKNVLIYGLLAHWPMNETSLLYYDNEYGVSMKLSDGTNQIRELLKSSNREQDVAEFRRFMYVGITRAIEQVYIFGKLTTAKQYKDYRLIEKILADRASPTWRFKDCLTFEIIKKVPKDILSKGINNDSLRKNVINRISNSYEDSSKLLSTVPINSYNLKSPSKLNDDEQEYIEAHSDSSTTEAKEIIYPAPKPNELKGTDKGTFIHKFLEDNVNDTLDNKYIPNDPAFSALTLDKQNEYSLKFKNIVSNFNNSILGHQLRDAKKNNRFYKAEWAFSLFLEDSELNSVCYNEVYDNDGGYILDGSIDLIYKNSDDTYTIVDYKSDIIEAPEHHLKQQSCYRKAAATLLNTSESNIHLYLYYTEFDKPYCLDDLVPFGGELSTLSSNTNTPSSSSSSFRVKGNKEAKYSTYEEAYENAINRIPFTNFLKGMFSAPSTANRYIRCDKLIYEKFSYLYPDNIKSVFQITSLSEFEKLDDKIRNDPDFGIWDNGRDANGRNLPGAHGGDPSAFLSKYLKYLKG